MAESHKTLEDLSISQIANQILTPLLTGLTRNNIGISFTNKITTKVSLGTPIGITNSFTYPGVTQHLPKPPPPGLMYRLLRKAGLVSDPPPRNSSLTLAVAAIHQQLVDLAINTSYAIDTSALPAETRQNVHSVPSIQITREGKSPRPTTANKRFNYPEELAEQLTIEKLKEIPIKLVLEKDKAPQTVYIPNTHPPSLHKSLAHTIYALGFTGEMLKERNKYESEVLKEFIKPALPNGFVHHLPPVQGVVYQAIVNGLKEKYNYSDTQARTIMRNSKCDLDRSALRAHLENILPFAEIYKLGCQLRGTEKDYFLKALSATKQYLGKPANDPICRDGFECAILLEGMLDYAIQHSKNQDLVRLENLKQNFLNRTQWALATHNNMPPRVPTVQEIIQLPESAQIVDAFMDVYAFNILMDRDITHADKALEIKARSHPSKRR